MRLTSFGSLILASTALALTSAGNVTAPTTWGLLAFPGVDLLDLYGPMEILFYVATRRHLDVHIITPTAADVVVFPPMGNPFNSTFTPHIAGNHTFDDVLSGGLALDVLLVPGGGAARDPSLTYVDDFLRVMAPRTDHLVTICTGAIFAARAGLLDGKRATTNKRAWDLVTAQGDNVTWVAPARFVRDANLWSSSGVSAGIDLAFAMVDAFYGRELHDTISLMTEIQPRAHDDDPFTDLVGVPHQGQLSGSETTPYYY